MQTAVIFAQECEVEAARRRSLRHSRCRYLGRLVGDLIFLVFLVLWALLATPKTPLGGSAYATSPLISTKKLIFLKNSKNEILKENIGYKGGPWVVPSRCINHRWYIDNLCGLGLILQFVAHGRQKCETVVNFFIIWPSWGVTSGSQSSKQGL